MAKIFIYLASSCLSIHLPSICYLSVYLSIYLSIHMHANSFSSSCSPIYHWPKLEHKNLEQGLECWSILDTFHNRHECSLISQWPEFQAWYIFWLLCACALFALHHCKSQGRPGLQRQGGCWLWQTAPSQPAVWSWRCFILTAPDIWTLNSRSHDAFGFSQDKFSSHDNVKVVIYFYIYI